MAEGIALVSLFVALAACAYAHNAHKRASACQLFQQTVCTIIESRSSRTVVCDLSDGRITIIKELKDAD